MRTIGATTGIVIIRSTIAILLTLTACIPLDRKIESPIDSLEGTLSNMELETWRMATQVIKQGKINDLQDEAISHLNTMMPTGFGSITTTPTPLSLLESPTAYPVCTPPACAPDEMYYCPGECPGGCGTSCATATPGTSSGRGWVWGKICFPGETIPEMTIYFQEINTQHILAFSILENQDSYQFEIPAGVYTAFAWLLNKDIGGGYTHHIECNPNISPCTDHTLIPFLVQEHHVKVDVDICDWEGDAGLIPAVLEE